MGTIIIFIPFYLMNYFKFGSKRMCKFFVHTFKVLLLMILTMRKPFLWSPALSRILIVMVGILWLWDMTNECQNRLSKWSHERGHIHGSWIQSTLLGVQKSVMVLWWECLKIIQYLLLSPNHSVLCICCTFSFLSLISLFQLLEENKTKENERDFWKLYFVKV